MQGFDLPRVVRAGARRPPMTSFCGLFVLAYLMTMQYWFFQEIIEPGRQYADPLLPSLYVAFATATTVTAAWAAIAAGHRRWRESRLRKLRKAVDAACARSHTALPGPEPMYVRTVPGQPVKMMWRPVRMTPAVDDIRRAAAMAYQHDVDTIIVRMSTAGEQATRILLHSMWVDLCTEHGQRKPVPRVQPMYRPARERNRDNVVYAYDQDAQFDLPRTSVPHDGFTSPDPVTVPSTS